MKAVVRRIPEKELAQRRKLGLDRLDEMWEGVLHMAPAPSTQHQARVTWLCGILNSYVTRHKLARLFVQSNVREPAAGERDYRVPDLCFVAGGREAMIGEVFIDGGPDLVVEVLSPDDETYEKMPFYARIGVPWLVVVGTEPGRVEVFRLVGERYVEQAPDEAGWIRCAASNISWAASDPLSVRLDLDNRVERFPA